MSDDDPRKPKQQDADALRAKRIAKPSCATATVTLAKTLFGSSNCVLLPASKAAGSATAGRLTFFSTNLDLGPPERPTSGPDLLQARLDLPAAAGQFP